MAHRCYSRIEKGYSKDRNRGDHKRWDSRLSGGLHGGEAHAPKAAEQDK